VPEYRYPVVLLAVLLGIVGIGMIISPRGFGRLARVLRISIPEPSPSSPWIARMMGSVVLAAAVVVLIAWG
jgi:hypothetical protein